MPCGCCLNGPVNILILSIFLIWIFSLVLKSITSKINNKGVKIAIKYVSWFATILVALVAVFLGVLSASVDLQQFFFSKLCVQLAKNPALNQHRCELLKNVYGNVLGERVNGESSMDIPSFI